MKQVGFLVGLLFSAMITLPVVCAQEDVASPVLVGFGFSPSSIDVTAGSGEVTVMFHVTDDVSGLRLAAVLFRSPSENQIAGAGALPPPDSGTVNDGLYRATMIIPEFAEAGTWTVESVVLVDNVNNETSLYTPDLEALGLPTQLDVVSVEDTSPPVLTDFSFTPLQVDVTSGPAVVMATFRITDNLSGLEHAIADFRSPSGHQSRGALALPPPDSGTVNDGLYQATMTVPEFAEAGTWTIHRVFLKDNVGNADSVGTSELEVLGFPTQLEVVSVEDTSPPVLTDFSFSPSQVDVTAGSATVTVTFGFTDDLSGVGGGHAFFTSPSGQFLLANASPPPDSGTANDGVYEVTATIPQFAEAGTWIVDQVSLGDLAGNRILIRTPELQALGFPTDLEVFGEENRPPVALCQDVTAAVGPDCNVPASLSIDGGSHDPDGDPISLSQSPPGPYPVGTSQVSLTVTDDQGESDTCTATVRIMDVSEPSITTDAPKTITPRDVPLSFTVTAADNCGPATLEITGIACTAVNGAGKTIDKSSSCAIQVLGNTLIIDHTSGVGTRISWTMGSTDAAGNAATATAQVDVVIPGKPKGRPAGR